MKVSTAIRIGYFGALNGNVTISGTAVPVYEDNSIPEGAKYPYIIISSQTERQIRAKRCRMYEATVLIDIVTGSLGISGRRQSEDIADQIDPIVNPITGPQIDITANGYRIGDTEQIFGENLDNKNNIYYMYRNLLRYRLLVEKI